MNLILNILKNIPLFQTLSEEEDKLIIDHITMQYFPAHYQLFQKGVLGSAMYLIKSGMVRIFNEEGDLASLGDGDFFGEMALIENEARMASAETLSDCEIFVLNKEDFAALMQKNADIASKVQVAYQQRKAENGPTR